jgi:YggT family protein
MISFLLFVVDQILFFLEIAIVANAVISWLLVFNVINIRHPVARQVVHFLDAITRPVLWPFRRIVPPLGGVDVTPILALIVIQGARGYLVPWLHSVLAPILG